MSPEPVELRRLAHLRRRGLPPQDDAGYRAWLENVLAEHTTLRLSGDLVVMEPRDWDDLKTLAFMFGWRPVLGHVTFGSRVLECYDDADAVALSRSLESALAYAAPDGAKRHDELPLDEVSPEVFARWAPELRAMRLLSNPVFVEYVVRLAGAGEFCVY